MEGKQTFNAEEKIKELNKIDQRISEIISKNNLSDQSIRLTLLLAHLKNTEGQIQCLGGDINAVEEYFQYVKNGK